MGIGGKNRISYSSKVSILQTGRDNFPDLPDLGSDSRIAVEIPVEFSTKGIRKRCVTLRAQTTVVEFLVEFCLAPSHNRPLCQTVDRAMPCNGSLMYYLSRC